MDEVLTFDEIKARFAPDWVLIDDPQTDETMKILGGKVVSHGPDPNPLYDKADELGLGRIAVTYLGEWPKDTIVML